MSQYALAFLFFAGFIIHEVEEIIMVKAWNRRHPRARSLFNGYAGVSTAAVATVILAVCELVAGLLLISISIKQIGIFVGVVAVVTVHFLAHFGDSLRNRCYTPGLMRSILLFPAGAYVLYILETTYPHHSGDNLVAFETVVCTGLLFLAIRSLIPTIQKQLDKYAAGGSS